MADTIVSVIDSARQELGKLGAGKDSWFTDDQILDRMLQHTLAPRSAGALVQFRLLTPASSSPRIWKWFKPAGWRHVYLYGIDFTHAGGASYTVNASGSIILKEGTDSSDPLYVTAVAVEFDKLMVDLLMSMATQRSQDQSQATMNGQIRPAAEYEQILQMAAVWQGVQSA